MPDGHPLRAGKCAPGKTWAKPVVRERSSIAHIIFIGLYRRWRVVVPLFLWHDELPVAVAHGVADVARYDDAIGQRTAQHKVLRKTWRWCLTENGKRLSSGGPADIATSS